MELYPEESGLNENMILTIRNETEESNLRGILRHEAENVQRCFVLAPSRLL